MIICDKEEITLKGGVPTLVIEAIMVLVTLRESIAEMTDNDVAEQLMNDICKKGKMTREELIELGEEKARLKKELDQLESKILSQFGDNGAQFIKFIDELLEKEFNNV